MNNIKSFIKSLFQQIGLVDKKCVWIDGGLGSQIIGLLQYKFHKKKDNSFRCDVSFFKIPKSNKIFLHDTTYREWMLGYYGHNLKDLISKKNVFKLRPNLKTQGLQLLDFYKNFNKSDEWRELFPIKPETYNYLVNKYDINNIKYSVIHIRKGDFLKYASLLINDDDVFNLLKSLKNILNKNVFFVSDDIFPKDYINKINKILNLYNVRFINKEEEFNTHALMRLSDILVTSNSMFSLSAALLKKKNTISIFPKKFFGPKFNTHNLAIDSLTNWTIY